MSDAVEGFFEGLRGHQPLLARAKGSVRVDLTDADGLRRWLVTIDRGDVRVSRRNAKADSRIRTSRDLFDGMVRGRVNVMASTLRGLVALDGDPGLLVLFRRMLAASPRPARATAPTSGHR